MTNPTERYTAEQMLWIANDLARVQSFDPMSAKWISKAHLALRQAASDVRDAERYRWLRDFTGDGAAEVYLPTDKNESGYAAWHGCTNKDQAIDTAMGERDE